MRKFSSAEDLVFLSDFVEKPQPVPTARAMAPVALVGRTKAVDGTPADALEHEFNNLVQVVKSAFNILARRPEISGSRDLAFIIRNRQQAADKAAEIGIRLLNETGRQ